MKQKLLSFLFVNLVLVTQLLAQVTTSSINGIITDEKGGGLPGATVIALHQPSGSKFGTTTREDGRYTLPNVRVGGPYVITISFVGYNTEKIGNIQLSLGQKFNQNFKMTSQTASLQEVVVKSNSILNGSRTGAATSINRDQLATLPTISRSQADFTRLNPMVAEGGSIAGRNPQFNNYSLDGAIFNNPFGLDAATPGGQTDAQAVSLDAIEQISVQIAPYDVTQSGMTGGSVNAVTKSGTNQFHGTIFGFTRNQNLVGNKVKDVTLAPSDLSQNQFGFSLGGPIIKDKLFFFANMEFDRRTESGSNWLPSAPGRTASNISRVLASDMQIVSTLLKSKYGYESGAYENFNFKTENQKAIVKLDWNINDANKLSFTYNYLDAFKEKPANPSAIGRRGPDFLTLQFQNAGYRINNVINGGIVELKTQLKNKAANKLQVGYTVFNDTRNPNSSPFPTINLNKDGIRYIVAGHEPFSINNSLRQSVTQFTDNFNLYKGDHTITLGASFERFNFDNSFNLGAYAGVFGPGYGTVEEFVKLVNTGGFDKDVADAKAAFDKNSKENKWALAQTSIGQASIYAQDEWSVNPKFTLTYGLRIDKPLYFDTQKKIEENIKDRNCCYDGDITYYNEAGAPVKLDSKQLPKSTPLFSPRVGFNYDIKGDRTQQLRGGSGLFTGRLPFVWIGNQVANPNFYFYCTTDPNFKFPQVWRTNLGYDHQFANGWIATTDLIYTKDINAQIVRNYGLKLPSAKLVGADTRPIYANSDRADKFGPTNAYVFTNTNLGYSLNLSLQLEKTFESGLYLKGGYNYLDSKDGSSIAAEISSDAYDRNPANVQHTNTPILAPSLYGNKHRFLLTAAKKISYGRMATTFSVFAEGVQGGRYSYTYAGDINNDGSGLNDLIFIPSASQIDGMKFSGTDAQQSSQKTALKSYIAGDKYLSKHNGHYAKKYASVAPWYSNIDVRILQDLNLAKTQKIQLSLDVLNIGNLINANWGVRQWASETGLAQPLGVSVDKGVPTYSFDTNQKSAIQNRFDLTSRWRMQFGLRYIF
jgi:hypothetical protein